MEHRLTPQQLAGLERFPKELMGALVTASNPSRLLRAAHTESGRPLRPNKPVPQWLEQDRHLGEHPPLEGLGLPSRKPVPSGRRNDQANPTQHSSVLPVIQ